MAQYGMLSGQGVEISTCYVKNILQDLDPNNTVVGSLSCLDESRKMYQNIVHLKQYDIIKYNLLCLWVIVKGILIS